MKKSYLSILLISICNLILSQEYWQAVNYNGSLKKDKYTLDLFALQRKIEFNQEVEIPNLNGTLENYKIIENSNFSPKLSKKYPNIKSYIGYSENGELRLSVSPDKIEGLIFENNGKIKTLEKVRNSYNIYEIKDKNTPNKLNCLDKSNHSILNKAFSIKKKTDSKLRTYRIAISATGEYTKYHGGTKEKALSAINASLTRVNAILEKEISVHLNLIPNNDKIIFTDPEQDPYSDADIGTYYLGNTLIWSDELQRTLSKIIGEENYDLGHLLSAEGDGGYSGGIGTVCKDGEKGKGFSSPYDNKPEGASFDIDFLTHEIGHQLGATHIFSRNEDTGTNVEPGSGSTIMGYAGIVDEDNGIYNVQKHSDAYFNQVNIFQINNTLKNKDCGVISNIAIETFSANAGEDYIIPAKTPFILKGIANGNNKENFSYTWEQLDNSKTENYSLATPKSINGPLFRSIAPSKNTERFFPQIENLLKHNFYSKFEALPQIARELNFGFIVRDGNSYGQSATDQMKIRVIDSETGFSVIQPKAFQSINSGEQLEIKWNVTNTNKAPINVSKVNIYLTKDGISNILLKENTDNDGSEIVTIPKNYSAKKAYIKIEAIDNIFFALSNSFSINYTNNSVCKHYKSIDNLPIAIPDGESTLGQLYGSPARINFSAEDEGEINSVSLNLNLEHPRTSDLSITLQSPQGETANLFNHDCDRSNFNVLISDESKVSNCSNTSKNTIKPTESLSKFNAYSPKGIWSLFIKDGLKPLEGKITDATLNICYTTYHAINYDLSTNKNKVRIYPNPASKILNVDVLNLEKSGISFKIYNLAGQLVRLQENLISTNSFTQRISLSGINKGVYILKVEGSNINFSTKLIIQ